MPRLAFRRALALVALLITAAASAWSTSARAQINVERDRRKFQAPGLSGKVQLSFGLKQGNVNLLNAGLNGNIAYERSRHLAFAFVDSQFSAQSIAREGGTISDVGDRDSRFKNRHVGHLRYNVRIVRWLIFEAFTQVETDEFLLVNSRFLVGTGPRFVLWKNEDFAAFFGSAYMPEREALAGDSFISQPGGQGTTNWWHRWSNYLSIELTIPDRVTLRDVVYVQPRFDQFSDVRLLNQAELEVKLGTRLGLKLIASITHDSRPPTYCGGQPEGGGDCPAANIVRLQGTDVGLQNAFTFEF